MSSITHDLEVQATNEDAASCKSLAVKLGYWSDPFISLFTKTSPRKPPEMNRGYYARVKGVHSLIEQFFETTKLNCQLVNLGAGFDSSFWLFSSKNKKPLRWVDVDFETVVRKKIRIISSKKQLKEALISPLSTETPNLALQIKPNKLHSSFYHVISCDLRNTSVLEKELVESGIDFKIPTLFLSECVLVYMESEASSRLVQWIEKKFEDVFFVNYEQTNMGDKFGQVMIENLEMRGCKLQGVDHCLSLQTHFNRFLNNGWQGADGGDMNLIYSSLPSREILRIEKIEFLDDVEMMKQLFNHYCITWFFKNIHQPNQLSSFQQKQQNKIISDEEGGISRVESSEPKQLSPLEEASKSTNQTLDFSFISLFPSRNN